MSTTDAEMQFAEQYVGKLPDSLVTHATASLNETEMPVARVVIARLVPYLLMAIGMEVNQSHDEFYNPDADMYPEDRQPSAETVDKVAAFVRAWDLRNSKTPKALLQERLIKRLRSGDATTVSEVVSSLMDEMGEALLELAEDDGNDWIYETEGLVNPTLQEGLRYLGKSLLDQSVLRTDNTDQ